MNGRPALNPVLFPKRGWNRPSAECGLEGEIPTPTWDVGAHTRRCMQNEPVNSLLKNWNNV